MGLIIEQGGGGEYEAVTLPQAGLVASPDTAVYLRRSARPSRRAVLHLSGTRGSFGPAGLACWYNERGFHYYVTELAVVSAVAPLPGRRRMRSARFDLTALDAARRYLREAGGIDAMILSAEGPAARIAAQWCDARRAAHPADALILSDPDFGRARRIRLNVGCPVLMISVAAGRVAGGSQPDVRLGQHVTWLSVCDQAGSDQAARRQFFDEMGRWLGAYMYGQVRDQLL